MRFRNYVPLFVLVVAIHSGCTTISNISDEGYFTSPSGRYFANALIAVPAVVEEFGYSCPALERLRNTKIQLQVDGSSVEITQPDGVTKTVDVTPSYRNFNSDGITCLRGEIDEEGKSVKFALCAKLKRGNGKKPSDWRSKGVFMAANGSHPEVNIGRCK